MKSCVAISYAIIVCVFAPHASMWVHAKSPGEILDLRHWLLTLPVDSDRTGNPDEISQPELAGFSDPKHFFFDPSSGGVIFRAECGGRTTKGSSYPRSELREMTQQRSRRAAWDTDGGIHQLTLKLAINRTPPKKKHVVCAQIHDATDDVMMVRLEGTKLFIERKSTGDVMLDRNYQLGTPFDLRIQAGKGAIQVWHNEELKMDWPVSRTGCYFKTGCYTQSNPTKGDANDAFGEVAIYRLELSY